MSGLPTKGVSLVAASLLCLSANASEAHDLTEVQQQMFERDQFFQIKEEPVDDFSLQDSDGNAVRLSDFLGKVVVLNFIYTNCPDVCPLHTEKLVQIQRMIAVAEAPDQIQFVTVSTDPGRDTPAVLRDYAGLHGIDTSNWKLLTTPPGTPENTTREIASTQFGIEFTPSGDDMLMHGVITLIIDREGIWRGSFHGLEFPPVDLVVFANALVNADHHADEDASSSDIDWVAAAIGTGLIGLSAVAFLLVRRRESSRRPRRTGQ